MTSSDPFPIDPFPTENTLLTLIGHCNDVIYVGAHDGQELEQLCAMADGQITLYEPQTQPFERLKARLPANITLIQKAISDFVGTSDFYVANNEESSSLLRMTGHKKHHPNILEAFIERVEVTTLDLEKRPCDLLVLDVQGNEMAALRGAVETIRNARFIIAEYGTEPLYNGQASLGEMTQWLGLHGFTLTVIDQLHPAWGNALYVRECVTLPVVKNTDKARILATV